MSSHPLIHLAPKPAVEDVARLVGELSNWNRWGSEDELGTLNTLTADRRRAAAALVRDGVSVSMARRLRPRVGPDNPRPLMHFMERVGTDGSPDGYASVADWIGLGFHGFAVTHIDALCHVMWDGRTYNGRPATEITGRGSAHNNVESLRDGIYTRGVLFDVPRALGVDWLEPGEALGPDALDHCESLLAEPLRPGDALILRFGRDPRAAAHGVHDPLGDGFPGLLPTCLPWLHARDLSLLGADTASDVMRPGGAPHLMPVHAVALVAMGLHLLDNAWLEDLADACAVRGRHDFCLTLAPLQIPYATGSPVNPTAVL